MALTPLKAGRVVKEAVNSGNQDGELTPWLGISRQRWGGAGWPREVAAWSGSTGARWEMELTCGVRLVVTEGEGVIIGLRKREKETYFGQYATAAQAGMSRARARPAGEKRKGPVVGWAKRPGGPAGRWADWAESDGTFPNKNWIFEFSKALEICRKRFRRNFGMRFFPQFF
jgi:hypothetical protein